MKIRDLSRRALNLNKIFLIFYFFAYVREPLLIAGGVTEGDGGVTSHLLTQELSYEESLNEKGGAYEN